MKNTKDKIKMLQEEVDGEADLYFWASGEELPIGTKLKKFKGYDYDGWMNMEAIFEKVRQEIAPDKPPRIGSVYVCGKKYGFCGGGSSSRPYIYIVRVKGEHKTFVADVECITEARHETDNERIALWAKSYWSGNIGHPISAETLIYGGEVEIVKDAKDIEDFDPYANKEEEEDTSDVWGDIFNEGSSILSERTLYHGTVITHKDSIQKHGVLATVGDWVQDSYGTSIPEEDDYELEPLVFAADKLTLDSAVGAMSYGIGKLLNKSLREVTIDDIRKYGLLVIFHPDDEDEPDSLGSFEQRPPRGEEGFYDEYPMQVEPNDYYSREDQSADVILTGNKLVSFLNRANVLPATSDDVKSLKNKIMRYLAKIDDKETLEKVKNVPDEEIPELYKKARKLWGNEFGDFILEEKSTVNEGMLKIDPTIGEQISNFIWNGFNDYNGVAYELISYMMQLHQDPELQFMKHVFLDVVRNVKAETGEYVENSELTIEPTRTKNIFLIDIKNEELAPSIGTTGFASSPEALYIKIETDTNSTDVGGRLQQTKNKIPVIYFTIGLDILNFKNDIMTDDEYWRNLKNSNQLIKKLVKSYKSRLRSIIEHELIHVSQLSTEYVSKKGLSHFRGSPKKDYEHDADAYMSSSDYYHSSDIEFFPILRNLIDDYISLYDEFNKNDFTHFMKNSPVARKVLKALKKSPKKDKYRKFIKILYTTLDTAFEDDLNGE